MDLGAVTVDSEPEAVTSDETAEDNVVERIGGVANVVVDTPDEGGGPSNSATAKPIPLPSGIKVKVAVPVGRVILGWAMVPVPLTVM